MVLGQALGLLLRRLFRGQALGLFSQGDVVHTAELELILMHAPRPAWNMTDLVQTCSHRGDATDDDDHRFRGDATG